MTIICEDMEASPDEFQVCMDVDTRHLIQLKPENNEDIDLCMKRFFHDNSQPRKKFVIDKIIMAEEE